MATQTLSSTHARHHWRGRASHRWTVEDHGHCTLCRRSRLSPISCMRVAVQSTIGKGHIRTLDASAAEKMPGVLLVFHNGNMEKVYRLFPGQDDGRTNEARPPFEDDNIYYWGQYVAVVVAETVEQARAAAEAVRVEYDVNSPTCAPI